MPNNKEPSAKHFFTWNATHPKNGTTRHHRYKALVAALTTLLAFYGAFDVQARTPKLVPDKTFVGGPASDTAGDGPTIAVDFDEEAYIDNGTRRWTSLHKGQNSPLIATYRIGIWDGYITDVFITHLFDARTNKFTDVFHDRPNVDESYPGEPAPRGVDPGPVGRLISGAFNDIGPWEAYKTLIVDNLPQAEKDAIVAACNREANTANNYTVVHKYNVFMRVYTRARRRKKTGFNSCSCPNPRACPCNQYAGYGTSKIHTVPGSIPINIQCDRPTSDIQTPEITDATLSVKTSGGSCPKDAKASVVIFGTGERKVRYRILRQLSQYNSPWFEGRIKKRKILGGEGYALVAEHKLKRKLGPGERKFRLQIEDWGRTKWQTVKVTCPPLKAENVVLSISGSGQGVVCPRETKTEVKAHTNGPGTITFHLRAVGGVNGAPYKAVAKREGDKYIARYEAKNQATIDIDKTYEAVVKNGPVSNEARLNISCIKPVSGKLTLRKKAGSACRAEALIAIHTNVGGTIPYELECGAGRSWQRNAKAPGANKIGVDKVEFAVKDKEQVICILRTRLGGQLTSLGGASQTFQCPSLSSGGQQGQESALPTQTTPDRVTTPPLRCLGGRVVGKRCICGSGGKVKRVRANVYQCVKTEPRITCTGGKAVGKHCRCQRGHKARKLGANRFKCIKDKPQIRCVNGKVRGKSCTCKRGWKLRKTGVNAYRCVREAAKVKCVGGKVRRGRCKCPRKRPALIRGVCTKPAG